MRISKQELLSKGHHQFTETIKYDSSLFNANPLIISLSDIKVQVDTEYISQLIIVKIKLIGEMVLHSTRTLKPVNYPLNINDQIIFTYNEDLIDGDEVVLLNSDELDLDDVFYSLIISSIPLQVIAPDDEELITGDSWEVITEDEYHKRHQEVNDSPFAVLNELDLDE